MVKVCTSTYNSFSLTVHIPFLLYLPCSGMPANNIVPSRPHLAASCQCKLQHAKQVGQGETQASCRQQASGSDDLVRLLYTIGEAGTYLQITSECMYNYRYEHAESKQAIHKHNSITILL